MAGGFLALISPSSYGGTVPAGQVLALVVGGRFQLTCALIPHHRPQATTPSDQGRRDGSHAALNPSISGKRAGVMNVVIQRSPRLPIKLLNSINISKELFTGCDDSDFPPFLGPSACRHNPRPPQRLSAACRPSANSAGRRCRSKARGITIKPTEKFLRTY